MSDKSASVREWNVLVTVSRDVSKRVIADTKEDAVRLATAEIRADYFGYDITNPFASEARKPTENVPSE